MKAKRVLLIVMVCALAFLVFAATASAKSADQKFKGSLKGEVWYTWVLNDPINGPHPVQTNSWAVGTAKHLGRITMSAHHPTPALGVDDYGPGEMVFKLHGYRIYATYTGSAHFVPGPDPAVIRGPGTFVIHGGTGPFRHATGEGTMTLKLYYPGPIGLGPDSPPWKAQWTFEGTIHYHSHWDCQ